MLTRTRTVHSPRTRLRPSDPGRTATGRRVPSKALALYHGDGYKTPDAADKDGATDAEQRTSRRASAFLVPIHRRAALLGVMAPLCCCALCGGSGNAATAARRAHQGRNPLYDSYFAAAMRYGMADYEAAIRPIKSQLFGELLQALQPREAGGRAVLEPGQPRTLRLLEVGVGTGPNFPYYVAALEQPHAASAARGPAQEVVEEAASAGLVQGRQPGLHIVGLDPNDQMLRVAAESARAAGMRLTSPGVAAGMRPLHNTEATAAAMGAIDAVGAVGAVGGGTHPVGPVEAMGAGAGVVGGAVGRAAAGAVVSLVGGQAEALPFPDGAFDAAVVTLVLCSVPSPAAVLAELRRVVRPMGRLLLIEHVRAGEGRPGLRLAQRLLTPLQRLAADGCSLDRDTGAQVRAAGWDGELRQFELHGFTLLAPHIAGVLVR